MTIADFDEYDVRGGPVHLQRMVAGDDIRAHVIGDSILAIRIISDEPDYRIASEVRFEEIELPHRLAVAICAATRDFGLIFAGWDFKVDHDNYWVLEVNPMPGYNYYDTKLDSRITQALVRYLEGPSVNAGGI